MTTIGLKGASGLGDTILAYPIVKYYADRYDVVYYMTDYPELYETLRNVVCSKHEKVNYINIRGGIKHPVNIRFTYCGRKYTEGTSQFQDTCMSAGVPKTLECKIDWTIKNKQNDYRNDKPVCVLSAPYEPFGREDQWGKLLRINNDVMDAIVESYKDRVDFVQIGNKYTLYKVPNVKHDLVNKTSVSDLMDIVSTCDIGLSQIGNLLPMCEALGKKSFTIFSKKALMCDNKFLNSITPDKVVHDRSKNCSIIDDDIDNAVRKFGETINL